MQFVRMAEEAPTCFFFLHRGKERDRKQRTPTFSQLEKKREKGLPLHVAVWGRGVRPSNPILVGMPRGERPTSRSGFGSGSPDSRCKGET